MYLVDGILYIPYIVVLLTVVMLTFLVYIRIRYGFWAAQPVYHIYDLHYMFRTPGILDPALPERNRYVQLDRIHTFHALDLTPLQLQRIVHLVTGHYLRNGHNIYTPTAKHITPYFVGHRDKPFVSLYSIPKCLLDTTTHQVVHDRDTIQGLITSRPLHVTIRTTPHITAATFRAYYVDYLCVHTLHRKQGIAPALIQTHHYNQRRLTPTIRVSLFKREEDLTPGIVPLCTYNTYGFPVDTWRKPPALSPGYSVLGINRSNFSQLRDFVVTQSPRFQLTLCTEMSNLLELIDTHNVFVSTVVCDGHILCAYWFRKTCVHIRKGHEALCCFASICGNQCDSPTFTHGFDISFWDIAATHAFGYAVLESLSHNPTLVAHTQTHTHADITSPTAYYFYNYIYPTCRPDTALILC